VTTTLVKVEIQIIMILICFYLRYKSTLKSQIHPTVTHNI